MAPTTHRETLRDAASVITGGGLVAMPTETVYGLAADATNDKAVARIFEAKGRPQFNPLIVHVTGIDMAEKFVEMNATAKQLAVRFWPGPLTIVGPRRADASVSLLVSAGLDTVALRMPDHPTAQALINATRRPLAAPSANRSGSLSPTRAGHVEQSLGNRVDFILDDGPCVIGIESTIVKVDGEQVSILRAGAITREDLEDTLGRPLAAPGSLTKPQAPGMLESHYAPHAQLRLNVKTPEASEAFLGFGDITDDSPYALNLSVGGDLREAAANFFAYLRALDTLCENKHLNGIAAAPIPQTGLGEAINDRLKRAAAPRS